MRFLNVTRGFLPKNVSPRGPNGPPKRPKNQENRYQKSIFFSKGSRRPFWSVSASKMRWKWAKIHRKGGPKTTTAISRKYYCAVGASTIHEVRRPRILSRNQKKTKNRPRGVPEGPNMRFLNVTRGFLPKNVSPRGPNGPQNGPKIKKIDTKSRLFSRKGPGGHFGAFGGRKWGENEPKSIDKEDRKRKRRFLENSALL